MHHVLSHTSLGKTHKQHPSKGSACGAKVHMEEGVSKSAWSLPRSGADRACAGRAPPGYWAFGNGVGALVLSSLTEPSWAVMLAWAFAIVQLVGTTQVRPHPGPGPPRLGPGD